MKMQWAFGMYPFNLISHLWRPIKIKVKDDTQNQENEYNGMAFTVV